MKIVLHRCHERPGMERDGLTVSDLTGPSINQSDPSVETTAQRRREILLARVSFDATSSDAYDEVRTVRQ
jgi:hypothetical protein